MVLSWQGILLEERLRSTLQSQILSLNAKLLILAKSLGYQNA